MSYSDFLKRTRKAAGLKQRELADAITARGHKVSTSAVSNIENGYYKKQDGSESQPARRFVELAAIVCNADVNEALREADYFASAQPTKPQTLPELVAALEALGIETPLMYDDLPIDDDGEAFREVVERIWLDVELVTKRLASRREAVIEQERIAADLRGEVVARIEPAKKAA